MIQTRLKNVITDDVRVSQSISFLVWAFIGLMVPLCIMGLLVILHNEIDSACEKHLRVWLLGMAFLMMVHFVRRIVLVAVWNTGEEPREKE